MATISTTIPDEYLPRVIEALAGNYGYETNIKDAEGNTIPNPETKAQFAKRMMAQWVKQNISAWESNEAAQVARTAAIANVELINIE